MKRLGMEIGAKAAVRLTNAVEVSLSYDGAFKEHYQDHTGLLNVKLEFRAYRFSKYDIGSTAFVPRRISKCSCGSLALPVLPAFAIG